ncbi:MAG: hypothetical protein HQL19_04635 [Candidatus Omnitrophica bacterium]|nr:hypothetical protein [Candidatus Omnitrophota bacterium]
MVKRWMVFIMALALSGCAGMHPASETPEIQVTQLSEAEWIHNGEPIEFENEAWYPTDELENLLDSEVYQVGKYRDIVFYLDRADVRPFERIYTRFGKNRYRAFEKQQ